MPRQVPSSQNGGSAPWLQSGSAESHHFSWLVLEHVFGTSREVQAAPVVVIASSSCREPRAVGVGPRWCAGGLVWSGGSGLAREAASE